MQLILYNSKSARNVINKELVKITELNIMLKINTNIYNPSLLLTRNSIDWDNVNYAQIGTRYYFVDTQNYSNRKFILLNLTEDTLETFKSDILNMNADIIEKSTAGTDVKQSNVSQETITKIYQSDTTIPAGESIIMQTTGTPNKEITG